MSCPQYSFALTVTLSRFSGNRT